MLIPQSTFIKTTFWVLFFVTIAGYAQIYRYNYAGILRVNEDISFTYKISFKIKNETLSGYSISDLGGQNETKSTIEGMYNLNSGNFFFNEKDVIYTKSKVDSEDFCFVSFKGHLKSLKNQNFKGYFKATYPDKIQCAEGHIVFNKNLYFQKRISKIREDKAFDDIESRVEERKIKELDSLNLNIIKANENTSVFWKDALLELQIWDAGKEDGDIVSIMVNDKYILRNYKATKEKKKILITLDKEKNIIQLTANSEGLIPLNTAKITLKGKEKEINLLANLKKGENASLIILSRKN